MARIYEAGGAALLALLAAVLLAGPARADVVQGRIFYDKDNDGTFSAGDEGVSNLALELLDGLGNLAPGRSSVLTSSLPGMEGTYTFGRHDVMPAGGTWKIRITNLAAGVPQPPPPALGWSAPVFVVMEGMPAVPVTKDIPNQLEEPPAPQPIAEPIPYMGTGGTPNPVDIPMSTQGGGDPDVVWVDDTDPATPPGMFPLGGRLFRDVGACDGSYRPGVDEKVAGRMVTVRILVPTTPEAEQPAPVMTDDQGDFSVPDVLKVASKTDYMVQISFLDDQGAMRTQDLAIRFEDELVNPAGQVVSAAQFRHPAVRLAAGCRLGSLAGRVTEAGTGMPLVNRRVDLFRITAAGEMPMGGSPQTDANGAYDFPQLEDGLYEVRVDGTGPPPASVQRIVSLGNPVTDADIQVETGPTCARTSCTAGHVHEVVVLTDIWVGDAPASIAVTAGLYADCTDRRALDIASLGYLGTTFPVGTPATGMDEVLTIEDVAIAHGWGTVKVRITANERVFPGGAFLDTQRLLDVRLNGRSNRACQRFRCETVQPGSRFPAPGGLYRVVDTWSWESWRDCENPDATLPTDGGGANDGGPDGDDDGGAAPPAKSKKAKKAKKAKKPKHSKHVSRRRR